MDDSYVCSKAKIKCSCGDKISTLTVYPDRTIWLTGQPQANVSDHISMRNIAPFGKCHTTGFPATGSATAANHGTLTPMPCIPNTPFAWMGGKNDVLLQNQPALLKSSSCKCVWGGTITFTNDGQVDSPYSERIERRSLTPEELDEEAPVELSPEELLDAIQLALDAAGMFPGLGAVPDILNACISACRGDWANAGLCLFAAVPGIGDAAGAAKLMKNGAKMAQKAKKAQKMSSGVDELAVARAKKQAKVQQEKLIEQGIAEGKVTRIETKRKVVFKKEATSGKSIEVTKLDSMETMSEAIAKGPNRELAAARAKRMGINPNDANFGLSMDSAPMHSQQKYRFGDLTKRDRFEIEEVKAIDNIHKSEEPSKILPGMIKDPTISTSKPVPEVVKSKPSDVIHGKETKGKTTKYPEVKVDPKVYKNNDKPVLGKNLDIEA